MGRRVRPARNPYGYERASVRPNVATSPARITTGDTLHPCNHVSCVFSSGTPQDGAPRHSSHSVLSRRRPASHRRTISHANPRTALKRIGQLLAARTMVPEEESLFHSKWRRATRVLRAFPAAAFTSVGAEVIFLRQRFGRSGPRAAVPSTVECAGAWEYPRAMNRGTGTGLIVFGVVMGVVGAIMAFAVTVRTEGFNINTAGTILLVVGIVVLVIGIAILVTGSRRSSTTVENVQNTPTGQERVEEKRDWGSP